jgi:hypothetical protein
MEGEARVKKKGNGVKGGILKWQRRFAPLLLGDTDATGEGNDGGLGKNYHLDAPLKVTSEQVNPRTSETPDK